MVQPEPPARQGSAEGMAVSMTRRLSRMRGAKITRSPWAPLTGEVRSRYQPRFLLQSMAVAGASSTRTSRSKASPSNSIERCARSERPLKAVEEPLLVSLSQMP
ncbi:hypothetical protein D3C84_960240 [compost metagenome]